MKVPLQPEAPESYLRQQLEAPDPALRLAALRALPPGALRAALRGRLADEDPSVQREALRLLRLRGDREAQADVAALLGRTRDAQIYVRCAATLAEWGDERAAGELRGAARARDAAVRALALSHIAGRDASVRRQIAQLLGSVPADVAMEVQRVLAQQGDGEARARLRDALDSPASPPGLRADVAEELVRSGDLMARTRLQELLRQDGAARGSFQRAAAVLGSGEACEALRVVAAHPQTAPGDRAEALRGLGACGLASDEALLRSILDRRESPEALRIAAAGALLALQRAP